MLANPHNISPAIEYFAVIFCTVLRDDVDSFAYRQLAERLDHLVAQQDGFLGMDNSRSDIGITISYWRDLDAIYKWRQHPEHIDAQLRSRKEFYESYTAHISRVERAYEFNRKIG